MFRRPVIAKHRPPSSRPTVRPAHTQPHPPHLSLLADKCTSMRQLQQIHAQMLVSTTIHDNFAASRLLSFSALSLNGDLIYASKLLNRVQQPNMFMWNTLIRGLAISPNPHDAVLLYIKMRRIGVTPGFEPNGPSLSSVLSACAQSGCLDMGEKIHRYIMEKGFETEVILGTALVNMYAKNGALLMARSCFDNMPRKNIITWNVMISGLAVHGHAKEALELFQELEKRDLVPNDSTFVGVLSACCHAGMFDFGRKVFNSMKNAYGIEPKIQHYGCMVDLLGRGGMVLEAEELINGMPWKADLKILGALLSACGSHGNIEVAERVVKKMLLLEHDNHGVYVVLSNMYADAG
ncbi:hypothetical protein L1987_34564 [Smallanthus sonchifolius]|uniref:Uncharacterized protein n=1 Tax=Smallanthus sonchifolius TaxID=185202 RepID=A0ACB9HVN9_9ASTR|nr:hypothetical protein L1987_34564 [Smallanthus sonchifolius]